MRNKLSIKKARQMEYFQKKHIWVAWNLTKLHSILTPQNRNWQVQIFPLLK
jgi:hypothetical protein